MTREEEIYKAAENNLDVSIYTPQDGKMLKETFCIGAKWADENPINIWHDVSEKPENCTHILIETSYFSDCLEYYSHYWSTTLDPSWKEYVKEYNVKRWVYLGDIVDI